MERNYLGVLPADLHGKFELVLEDHAGLHAEVQALRREMHAQHELLTFLLKALAADLAAHLADPGAHAAIRSKSRGRPAGRPAPHAACHPPG